MSPKKVTEEEIPMIDAANKEVLDFSKKEDAEADKIFYEAQGLQPDGVTPLGEEPEEKPEDKPEDKPEEKPEDEKGMPTKEDKPKEEKPEDKPKGDDDLTKGLTTENADKRISAAQNKMHTSNKTAKDAVERQGELEKENAELRKLYDEKITKPDDSPENKKPKEEEQTPDEVDADLEKLRIEYPEIAEPMIKMMQRQNAENKSLKDRLDKVDEREVKRVADDKTTKEDAHYDAIKEVHKDFHEISQEPLLDEWIDGLPAIEKAGAKAIRGGGSTQDVISLLTTFKKANGYKVPGDVDTKKKTPNTKLEKAKAHVTPQFNKTKEVNTGDEQIRFTQEQIHAMSDKEFLENESKIDEAMALGLVR